MIKINTNEVVRKHFPDNTQILLGMNFTVENVNNIVWQYESDEELVTLYFLVQHIRHNTPFIFNPIIKLQMYYCPNARMDRVKSRDEVFTLKHFAKFINDLHFDLVEVFDPHSDVSCALIDNIYIKQPFYLISNVIQEISKSESETPILYFPDAGAKKRYNTVYEGTDYSVCFGEKVRDWSTGKIQGLEVKQEGKEIDFKDKTVLMIDDIISYGGTMYYSALKLKDLGVKNIYIYCSHLENSVLDKERGTLIKLLDDGTINKLYTTNSLFTGKHKKIEIMNIL